MSGGKIAMIVVGAILALIGFVSLAVGGTLIGVNFTQRDASGYYTTPTVRIETEAYALSSNVDLGASTSENNWVPLHVLGTVRIRATEVSGAAVFIGIGPRGAVEQWLLDVPHARVNHVDFNPFRMDLQPIGGSSAPSPPSSQTFWVAHVSGRGTQTLTWPSRGGNWTAVIMKADASSGVSVDVNVGANTGILLPFGIGGLVVGFLALGAAVLLIALGARRDRPRAVPPGPYGGGGAPAPPSAPGPVPTASGAPGPAPSPYLGTGPSRAR